MGGDVEKEITQWLEQQKVDDVWDSIRVVGVLKTEEGIHGLTPSNPSALWAHLKAIDAYFVKYPELLKRVEFQKTGPHSRMLRKSVYGGLFQYWMEKGATRQEVVEFVEELSAFEWLRPEGNLDITETVSEGFLRTEIFYNGDIDCVDGVLQGVEQACYGQSGVCPPSLKVYLSLMRGYLKKSRDGWPLVADGVRDVRPSDVAHGVLCFLNSVKLKKVLFISEVSAGLAPADTDGLLYQNWSEIIATATPESAFLLDKFSPGTCHIYIMTAAVILKLPEIWPEVERLGNSEAVFRLLQSLNRPDAKREDYRYLDTEWDRLQTMLKVVGDRGNDLRMELSGGQALEKWRAVRQIRKDI